MNNKTIIMCAVFAGSMQQSWGMHRGPGYELINPHNPVQYSPSAPLMTPSQSISMNNNVQYSPSAPLMSPSNSIRPSNSNNLLPHLNDNARVPAVNNNNSSVPRQEVSEIARLAAAIEALNLNVENMSKQLNDRMTNVEQKIETVENKVVNMTQYSKTYSYNHEQEISLYDLKEEIKEVRSIVSRVYRNTK